MRRALQVLVMCATAFFLSPVSCLLSQEVVDTHWPSLFCEVVVVDSQLGVRVVSVEDASQAHWADLRPDDIIVRVHEKDIRSIDDFAAVSRAMGGRAVTTTVLVFRNGKPKELTLHLYSYPVLREWGLEFIPDHDVRFAEAHVGLDYWSRLGRGFEDVGKPAEALDAYLNGLHNVPTDVNAALHVSGLYAKVSRQHLTAGELLEGFEQLHHGLLVLQRLFDYRLTGEQLRMVRNTLHETLSALRAATRKT